VGAAGLAGAIPTRAAQAAPAVTGASNTTVQRIEPFWIEPPYKPIPTKYIVPWREGHMTNTRPLCKVTLANGVVGYGEGGATEPGRKRVLGRPAAESMWDDQIGQGLQMALFDAVGKTNEVPIHRLLGRKVRDRAFLSWWAGGMPAEDWVRECKEAVSLGYRAFKGKARPWYDLDEQCRVLTPTLPAHFQIDFDFNSMLLDVGHAEGYLIELEKYSQIAIYETPIPQTDVAGNKMLRKKTRIPIAMHFGNPPIMTALREEVCDALIIGGGASSVMRNAAIAATANKPFWLQMTGTSIMATFSMHCAAVLSHARIPAINLNHLFAEAMIRPAIKVENGSAAIPDGPGLGVEIDLDAVERYRIERPRPRDGSGHLLALRWPSGTTSYYAKEEMYKAEFLAGSLPVFAKGIYVEEIPNDGSREWKELQARAAKGGVHVGGRPR
jgi:L-alanine-DL-glutamate epimerase-like enolase superfamily enzyme